MWAPLATAALATSNVRAEAPPDNVCSAAMSAAQQLRSDGNLAGARARLSACLSSNCPNQVQECARRLAAINAEMPSIVVEARDEASNYVSDARATMDGAPLLERLDGKEIFVNPGEHRVTLDAAGFRRSETIFVARPREKRFRVVLFLISAPSPSAPKPSTNTLAASSPSAQEQSLPLSSGRKVGLAFGYTGIAGLAVGTIWSILSKATYDTALQVECGGDPNHCSPEGIADGRTAHRQAAISTIGFVTGGLLLGTGAVIYFASPKHDFAVAPAINNGGGGMMVTGKW
jgi:hypothetical protein